MKRIKKQKKQKRRSEHYLRSNRKHQFSIRAQMSIEYMLLLMLVVTLVLIGFKKYLPQTRTAANQYFYRISGGIMDEPNPCGDNVCDSFERVDTYKCCADCGGCP